MADLIETIKKIKEGNLNEFRTIELKMKPILTKYTNYMYKDEKEDIYAELILALWEAIVKIEYYDNEGKVLNYFQTAIKNKFFELYRTSRKKNDNECSADENTLLNINSKEGDDFNKIILLEDMKQFIDHFSGNKKLVYMCIIIDNLGDTEISQLLALSRQYINRLRKQLRNDLETYYK